MKKFKRWIAGLGAVLLLLGAASGLYLHDYYQASPEAVETAAMGSADLTLSGDWKDLVFVPEHPTAGLIFYPGGKVQYEAYALLMRSCAEQGILCVLLHMPGNLAVLDIDAADDVMAGARAQFPEVTDWYIGGHSLGGAMASAYIGKHTDEYKGLILLAAYSTENLRGSGLKVLSVYGTEDNVLSKEKYEANRENLPEDCTERVLDGGCHAYFGDYGPQDGDGTPTITREEQMRLTAEAIAQLVAG